MNNTPKNLIVGAVLAGLAGCMGGGGASTRSALTFDDHRVIAKQFSDEIRVLNIYDPGALPTMGSANYTGNLGFSASPGTTGGIVLFGDLALNANFQNNAVTGAVTDIVDNDDNRYAGSFGLTSGQIDRTANTAAGERALSADVSGEISAAGGATISIDATLAGDFFGDTPSHVTGTVAGNVVVDGITTGIINGVFAADQ